MYRLTLFASVALMGTACIQLDPSLGVTGTIFMSSNGVAMFDDGAGAHAGMLGSTCDLGTHGRIGDDTSVGGGGRPEVLGTETNDEGEDVVLVRTRRGLHLIESTPHGGYRSAQVVAHAEAEDLHAAAITQQGTVALHGCTVSFLDHGFQVTDQIDLDHQDCSELNLVADPLHGEAFLTDGGALWTLSPHGVDSFDLAGQVQSFNTTLGGPLVLSGSTEVQSVSPSGELQWSADLSMPVLQVQDFPNSDTVLVVTGSDPTFDLVALDAHTGQILREVGLPRFARIHTSADGQTFALARPNSTQFVRWR